MSNWSKLLVSIIFLLFVKTHYLALRVSAASWPQRVLAQHREDHFLPLFRNSEGLQLPGSFGGHQHQPFSVPSFGFQSHIPQGQPSFDFSVAPVRKPPIRELGTSSSERFRHRSVPRDSGPIERPIGHPAPPFGQGVASSHQQRIFKDGPGGCETTEGFRFAGETWYVPGCRRRKCIHFRGNFFTETDACDTEIYNTTYKCIIEVDIKAEYPHCCPRYRCNPDNLGNDV